MFSDLPTMATLELPLGDMSKEVRFLQYLAVGSILFHVLINTFLTSIIGEHALLSSSLNTEFTYFYSLEDSMVVWPFMAAHELTREISDDRSASVSIEPPRCEIRLFLDDPFQH